VGVIFLAGIHGVGKGYVGEPVAKRLGIHYAKASDLIRAEKGRATWTTEKHVAEIEDNQEALARSVLRLVESEFTILLDGHFVLRDTAGNPQKLPVSLFSKLPVAAAVLLHTDARTVATRLHERDGVMREEADIRNLAGAEAEHAASVCNELGIPLFSLHGPTEERLAETIASFVSSAAR
jgi:adenylate kinase